jgi:hypothetical protein
MNFLNKLCFLIAIFLVFLYGLGEYFLRSDPDLKRKKNEKSF